MDGWMIVLDGTECGCGCGTAVGSDEECSLADSPGVMCSSPGRQKCIFSVVHGMSWWVV